MCSILSKWQEFADGAVGPAIITKMAGNCRWRYRSCLLQKQREFTDGAIGPTFNFNYTWRDSVFIEVMVTPLSAIMAGNRWWRYWSRHWVELNCYLHVYLPHRYLSSQYIPFSCEVKSTPPKTVFCSSKSILFLCFCMCYQIRICHQLAIQMWCMFIE